MMAKSIPDKKKKLALKAIDKNFAGELLKPQKTVSQSTDPRVQVYNAANMVDNKSPEHIFQKRQLDFEINLKKDLIASFKVLENEGIPLKFKDISISPKKSPAGEIFKSDINIVRITLIDQFGNIQVVEMEIPRIDENTGTFLLNGRRKALINQIVTCPITFPAAGESRFESSYSTFRIHAKKLRSIEFLESYIGSYKLPLMILSSFAFGFAETLRLYKLDYEITQTKPSKDSFSSKINKRDYIVFKKVDSELKKQLCKSFIQGKVFAYEIDAEFGSKEYFEKLIIEMTGRLNSTFIISSNIKYVVDPVAKQVLKNMQLPFELKLIMKYMAEKVIEGYMIPRNDLNNQRIRNSEVLVHLAQKQILAAYTAYKEQVLSGNKEAKLDIHPTKVLSDFLNTELVVNMEYANPIEEMSTLTRVSPSGKKVGGIDKRSITPSSRNLHDSYFGNLDPLDTSESDNIGLVQQLTIDAMLSSSRGLFSTKNLTNTEGSGMLSTTTSLVPFLENTDGARVIMVANQAKQAVPLKDPQPPVVQSGYESILPGVLSENFIKRSPCNGKIAKITNDEISIQCGDKKQNVDITPIHLKSGSGKNTLSVFNPLVEVGTTVKKGHPIAEGACMSNGSISLGRPLLTAIMPYKGYNFEDGAVISESVVGKNKLLSLHGIEEEILVSENDRLLFIAGIGEKIEKGKPILRKTMGEIEQLIGFDEDESTDLSAGQYIKKSPGGKIVDIQVFSNLTKEKFPQLKDLIARTNKKFGRKSKESFKIAGQIIRGVLIKFVIEQELQIKLGDKLCNRYGNKGIISLVEKDELMPRTPFGEKIEAIFNPLGIIGRMNLGQLYELYCGLIAKELGNRIPGLNQAKMAALIKKVYSHLDTSKNKKYTETLVNGIARMPKSQFTKLVNNVKKTGFYPIIIPPFKAPKHTDISNALKSLGLKSAYTLTLPEFNTKTQAAVPVGYMYIYKLEHLGESKIYGRSTGPAAGKTGQPTSGKKNEGGQRLGELDTYSFISYNCPSTLAEFMGPLSDDYITREEIMADVIQTGEAAYREPKISPARDLLNSYFISLMLSQ
jgi:DNA-directed RNA polymerase beta subunit